MWYMFSQELNFSDEIIEFSILKKGELIESSILKKGELIESSILKKGDWTTAGEVDCCSVLQKDAYFNRIYTKHCKVSA